MSTAPSQPGSYEFRSGAKGHAINESEVSAAGLPSKNAEPTPMVPLPETQSTISLTDAAETMQTQEQSASGNPGQSQLESAAASSSIAGEQPSVQVSSEPVREAIETSSNTPIKSLKSQEDQFAKQVEANATGAATTEPGK